MQSNRREKVIATLKQEYGALKTLEVAAFGTETAKSAIKTACRAYNIDVDEANYLSSLITADRGILHTLSQTYYGDEENDISSNRKFVTAMNKYPKVWELAQRIEGLVTRIGKHASGIVITEEDFTEYAAIMATNKLDLISQFDLGDLEKMGCIKIDMLSIEALDKIRATLDLLIQYGYIQPEATLKATYEKVLGVYNLERNDLAMWDMVHQNKVISLFQLIAS